MNISYFQDAFTFFKETISILDKLIFNLLFSYIVNILSYHYSSTILIAEWDFIIGLFPQFPNATYFKDC